MPLFRRYAQEFSGIEQMLLSKIIECAKIQNFIRRELYTVNGFGALTSSQPQWSKLGVSAQSNCLEGHHLCCRVVHVAGSGLRVGRCSMPARAGTRLRTGAPLTWSGLAMWCDQSRLASQVNSCICLASRWAMCSAGWSGMEHCRSTGLAAAG